MARPKKESSKGSLMNLGLTSEEDAQLLHLLNKKDLSIRQICRALLRQWMAEGGNGLIKRH